MTSLANPRRRTFVLAVAAAIGAAPEVAAAQQAIVVPGASRTIARADALLRAGRIEAAEALYYREAHRRPRDPVARLALGRYLASRGATRIGTVLIEEARFFGASPVLAALHLAPLYARLGDYKALALLPGAPLSTGERARAEWLAKNPPTVAGPESLSVALAPTDDDSTPALGAVVITVDGQLLIAEIDPTVRGLVVDTSRASLTGTRVFGGATSEVNAGPPVVPAVLSLARIGALTFRNVPVNLEPLGSPSRARIGLDLLGRFAPSFQPRDGRLVMRRSGKVPRLLPGQRVPLLVEPHEAWVVWEGRREPFRGELVTRLLRGARWTLDARRGEIVLQS